MATPDIILFDDGTARDWEPFALTRPVGELLFGVTTLRERVERAYARRCAAYIAADHLEGFEEPGAPRVLKSAHDAGCSDRLFLVSRFVPSWGDPLPRELREGPVATRDGTPIGWYSPAGTPPPSEDVILNPESAASPTNSLPGLVLDRVWKLVTDNIEQIGRDVRALFDRPRRPLLPAGSYHLGNEALIIDPTAVIEPGVVFDTSGGPIWIDRDARVRALTRLAGPAYVGPGSTVLGGALEAVSIGPVCRIRGEFAESVCVGYVNKQHDGHIGHAYLGRWVNLGAETTNSDLKNNYGSIRVWTPDAGATDTGQVKLGSLIGDHVKTGIGTLLNTGTVVGAGSNIYGAAMPPTYVPPFSWGTGHELVEFRLDKFLEVAERAMGRRKVAMTDGMRGQLRRAWEKARGSTS
jgi:UDP-N-acetylglucosamine diphosphorylase/glucosamine-1-phosphate N-acetyltransferase